MFRPIIAAAATLTLAAVTIGAVPQGDSTNPLATTCGSGAQVCAKTVTVETDVRTGETTTVLLVRFGDGDDRVFTSADAALAALTGRVPACVEEDSPACLWDASTAGNGVGESFLVIGGHAEGEGQVVYLSDLN